MDAAIAAVALQGVVEPQMTGVGGDCFVIYSPKGGAPVSLNGSGRTPAKTDLAATMAKGAKALVPTSIEGVTIPGANRCVVYACGKSTAASRLKRSSSRPSMPPRTVSVLRRVSRGTGRPIAPKLESNAAAKAHYLPGGAAPQIGDRRDQPALGKTLRRIAREGRAAFYEGEVAEEIVSVLQALGGVHTAADFAANKPEDVHFRFQRLTAVTMFLNVRRTGRALRR